MAIVTSCRDSKDSNYVHAAHGPIVRARNRKPGQARTRPPKGPCRRASLQRVPPQHRTLRWTRGETMRQDKAACRATQGRVRGDPPGPEWGVDEVHERRPLPAAAHSGRRPPRVCRKRPGVCLSVRAANDGAGLPTRAPNA
eukprot:CAMPEP_0172180772 /NCGR_PEP_ID=MMETSP1050-20130122/17435_1 /TAXON_ID=233186 /ORGANISM="Cryptomonas curvata, Strain CCAP979/52" /LENGTH=140 /DNA_ID=CAMNT_0012853955 /DNA_START=1 /DNA_END=420 /DNA_ORIENTATION=-